MQPIRRLSLPAASSNYLRKKEARLASLDQAAAATESKRIWKSSSSTKTFTPIRDTLRAMSNGLERCMYCEDGQGVTIDHFEPRSLNPYRSFDWTNYLLACAHCNSNLKRDRYPLSSTGNPLLIDPTLEDPKIHLQLIITTGEFTHLTTKGLESIEIFGLNKGVRPEGRRNAITLTCQLSILYHQAILTADTSAANEILEVLRLHPFGSIRRYLDETAHQSPILIRDDRAVQAFLNYPELTT